MDGLLSQGRSFLTIFNNSIGQLRAFTPTPGSARSDDGTWANTGSTFKCSLYEPKGNEIPEALALLDRTVYFLSGEIPASVTPQHRVVVDGTEYEIHDDDAERTNAFFERLLVSRLK